MVSGEGVEGLVVNRVPVHPKAALFAELARRDQAPLDEAFEGPLHGLLVLPPGELSVPLLQRVAHPPPENAARPLALVEGVQEPEVELLQDQGLVETQQASQARQDLKRRFVDQEFGGHSGGWSLLGRTAPGKEVALESLLPGAACLVCTMLSA